MRVLITGVTGFAGRWLARELAKDRQIELYGVSRSRPQPGELPKKLHFIQADLSRPAAVRKALQQARPDRIHHLAGQASVSRSWKNPSQTVKDNVRASQVLLDGLARLGLRPSLHLAGSAEVYGRQRRARIRETDRPSPRNPYARSKLAQERVFIQYARRHGLPLVITRAFNHIGPGQKGYFVLPDFSQQIVRAEKGEIPPVLKTGNTAAIRDFTDVRDVVRAYSLAIKTNRGLCVYNVASGRARTIGELVRKLARASRVDIRVVREMKRVRPEDLPRLVGDASLLRRQTGWRPKISLDQTLRDTLRDWRQKN